MALIFYKKFKTISLFLIAIILFFDACKTKSITTKPIEEVSKHENYLKATITQNTMDGCSWIITVEEGKKLEPINLSDEFKIDNLKIWLQYKNDKGNSVCMMGQMIYIIAIEKR